MPYKIIGRTTDFKGKTLWEIVGNLKNFGVGRIVARNMFERYPEPSFMKIVKVEALPNPANPSIDNLRKVKVLVERTFRGVKHPTLVNIESASYKTDYKLIPKDEEAEYCKLVKSPAEPKVLPKYASFPPLLRIMLMQEMAEKGKPVVEPKLEIVYKKDKINKYKISEDFELPSGLGTPASPSLYKGIKL